ncbi:MAG TPA: hypothetical protein VFM46_10760 [Pseudomonadales bacterium]|nr:hypothetical protein [Pseudomonadales bacterium]
MNRMQIALVCAGVAVVCAARAEEKPAENLCQPGEAVYFNCVTAKQKSISLCGSPDLSKPAAYLQYRFGKKDSAELVYPEDKKDSLKKFEYSHFFRPQTDRFWLGFDNAGYSYSIFMNYEAPDPFEAGVSVTTPDGKEGEVKCQSEPELKADELEKVLQCNNEELSELGCPQGE